MPDFAPDAPIALGALAEVRDEGGTADSYFLCPRAGGLELQVENRTILVVTPQSPLGRQLLGRRVGDPVQLPGSRPPARITSVL